MMTKEKVIFLSCSLILISLSFSCRKSSEENSAPKSIQTAIMVTTSVVEWLLDKALEIPVQKKFEELFTDGDEDDQDMGNATKTFSAMVASKLKIALDESFEREVQVKLNSLETSLSRDYVPGLGESATQLALMAEKANDIRSAIESLARDPNDLKRIGMALSHHHTYLMASAVKVYILSERLKMARGSVGKDAPATKALEKSLRLTAEESKDFLETLATKVTDNYVRRKLLVYSYQEESKRENFGFLLDVKYRYCVKSLAAKDICGPFSESTCPNQFSMDCVTKAKKEAEMAFSAARLDAPLFEDVRSQVALGQFERLTQKLAQIKSGPLGAGLNQIPK